MTTQPIIEVSGLTVRYGGFTAVSDVSFEVRAGELYALLGTNGAGKTSTLETLEGHQAPHDGHVTVFGHSPADRAAVRPRTGIMLQESGFAGDLTCAETVREIGAVSGRRDEIDRVLAVIGLTAKRDVRVSQLSGGEKRRLDFATAIFGSPTLLFLDEPTTGLDIAARDELWAAVERLREDGTTVLLTTHYLEEAQRRADRIGVMHEGRLTIEGTMAQLGAALPATIRFVLPASAPALPLPVARLDGPLTVIETRALQRDLTALLSWADAHGLELPALEASSGSLDDLFRTLTTKESTWAPSLAAS